MSHWLWTLAKAAAAIGGFVAGYHFTPEWIIGIPFVQVLLALFVAGVSVMAVEIVRVTVSPENRERAFAKAAGMILFAIVAIEVHKFLYRLGIVDTPADEHYSRLAEEVER
jgi:hypothetical protein